MPLWPRSRAAPSIMARSSSRCIGSRSIAAGSPRSYATAPSPSDTVMTVDTLDPAQRAAATQAGSIQLVLAGPGSGKTTTLVGRFVHLVRQGADRRRILALTFTRKAADDMKARIVQAL